MNQVSSNAQHLRELRGQSASILTVLPEHERIPVGESPRKLVHATVFLAKDGLETDASSKERHRLIVVEASVIGLTRLATGSVPMWMVVQAEQKRGPKPGSKRRR